MGRKCHSLDILADDDSVAMFASHCKCPYGEDYHDDDDNSSVGSSLALTMKGNNSSLDNPKDETLSSSLISAGGFPVDQHAFSFFQFFMRV